MTVAGGSVDHDASFHPASDPRRVTGSSHHGHITVTGGILRLAGIRPARTPSSGHLRFRSGRRSLRQASGRAARQAANGSVRGSGPPSFLARSPSAGSAVAAPRLTLEAGGLLPGDREWPDLIDVAQMGGSAEAILEGSQHAVGIRLRGGLTRRLRRAGRAARPWRANPALPARARHSRRLKRSLPEEGDRPGIPLGASRVYTRAARLESCRRRQNRTASGRESPA
jgi:hypothetical protein